MKRTLSIFSLALMLTGAACGERESASSAATPATSVAPSAASGTLTPEQLGALGAELRKDPARGDELLTRHGLTRQTFEQAIRDVTENANASQRYAEAYRKASA